MKTPPELKSCDLAQKYLSGNVGSCLIGAGWWCSRSESASLAGAGGQWLNERFDEALPILPINDDKSHNPTSPA
jgi:hypothetical protein